MVLVSILQNNVLVWAKWIIITKIKPCACVILCHFLLLLYSYVEYLKEAKNSQSMDKMEYEEPDMATSTTPYKRKREKSFDTISSKKFKEMS